MVFAATIAGDLKNNAVVPANPTLNDRTDIPNRKMTATNPPVVDQLDYSPSGTIITLYISEMIKALRAPLVSKE